MAVIYHNPRCGTSRNVLQTLRDLGHDVEVIEYLKQPLDQEALGKLIQSAGISVREAIRSKEAVYAELGLDDSALSDERTVEGHGGQSHLDEPALRGHRQGSPALPASRSRARNPIKEKKNEPVCQTIGPCGRRETCPHRPHWRR